MWLWFGLCMRRERETDAGIEDLRDVVKDTKEAGSDESEGEEVGLL